MENPFELIMQKLERIENLFLNHNVERAGNNKTKPYSEIMSVQQLSDYLDLSKSHIYKKTSSREIPHSKRGKKLYFEKSVIDDWVLENKITTSDEIEQLAANYILNNKRF